MTTCLHAVVLSGLLWLSACQVDVEERAGCWAPLGRSAERATEPTVEKEVPEDFWIALADRVDVVWSPDTVVHAVWHGPEGLLGGAVMEWHGDTLEIADDNVCRWLKRPTAALLCSLFTPPPAGLHITGHGRFSTAVSIDRRGRDFTVRGERSLAEVTLACEADSMALRVPSGAMRLAMTGQVRRLGVSLVGLSNLRAESLRTNNVQAYLETNQFVSLHAENYAYIALAGTGDVALHGAPNEVDEENAGQGGTLTLMP